MQSAGNPFLIVGGTFSAVAAALHLGCIAFGAPWYRLLGAGERMARMASAGRWYPKIVTLVIAAVLLVWSAYALSGAGIIGRLPYLRWVLCCVTGVYILRGVSFVPLMSRISGNSLSFWLVSSAICLVVGVVHLIGVRQVWDQL
jgi:hypothetical protein